MAKTCRAYRSPNPINLQAPHVEQPARAAVLGERHPIPSGEPR